MAQAIGIALAIVLGGTSALQVALLGAMSRGRGPAEAAWVSLLGSVLSLALVLAARAALGPAPALPPPFERLGPFVAVALAAGLLLGLGLRGIPAWFALTGMLATPYLLGASYLTPRLGIGLFLAAIIAGQLGGAVALDHLGAFGATPRPVDGLRLAGIGLLLLGVALVRGR
jgi:transporter family-2 protein